MVNSDLIKDIENIADVEAFMRLFSQSEEEDNMIMNIKPTSRHVRCPKCNENFKHIPKLGWACLTCLTKPDRFHIAFYWKKEGAKAERCRIGADKQGQVLDSYQRAVNLAAHIKYEIDSKSFDPDNYKTSNVNKFWTSSMVLFIYNRDSNI